MSRAEVDARAAALRPRPTTIDTSLLLALTGPEARTILAAFIVVHGVLAFTLLDPRATLGLCVLSYLALTAAAIIVTLPAADPLPRWRSAAVIVLCSVTTIIQLWQLSPGERPLFADWHEGAVTMVLAILALRGRIAWAWSGYTALVVSSLVWAELSGAGFGAGVGLVIRHAATLLVASLFAIGIRRTAARLAVFHDAALDRQAADAAEQAAARERESQLTRLDALAGTLLTKVAEGVPLTAAERDECLLVEAALRDQVRGRGLVTADVAAAAHAARSRGVQVTLLDDSDSDGAPSLAVETAAASVVRELGSLATGSLVARLLPPARDQAATILVQPTDAAPLALTVDHDGALQQLPRP